MIGFMIRWLLKNLFSSGYLLFLELIDAVSERDDLKDRQQTDMSHLHRLTFSV